MVSADRYVAYYRAPKLDREIRSETVNRQRKCAQDFARSHGIIVREIIGRNNTTIKDLIDDVKRTIVIAERQSAVLIIARCGNLHRSVEFLSFLIHSGHSFIFADRPEINQVQARTLLADAERERETIRTRVQAALRERKARGVKLGNPNLHLARKIAREKALEVQTRSHAALRPIVQELRASGLSLRQIAQELNERFPTPYRRRWHASSVRNILLIEGPE